MSEFDVGKIISHYRIENLIGSGGMGTVYKAFDLNLERHVALKLMHPQIASVREFRERLKAEAKAAANLDHPSIVQIYNFNETEDGNLFVAMEYLRDGSLREHLQRTRSRGAFLDIALALQITIEIAEALDYAHHVEGRAVIHRDVKPGNIILKRLERSEKAGFAPFRAVLTDFGLVQVINSARITNMGITMGTPLYMSPEQCEGLDLDGRSDLYSLGVVFYEMLAGRPPFNFSSLTQAISAHVRERYPNPVRDYRPDVPPLLEALVAQAMEKDPDKRFRTGKAMADALRAAFFSISDTPTRFWHSKPFEDTGGTLALSLPDEPTELVIRSLDTDGHVHVVDRYPLADAIYKIGRKDDNTIVLGDDAVSRHHAQLEHTPAGWIIRARSSVNGTFLNGRRLRPDEPMLLKPGEPIRMGPYELWINTPQTPVNEPEPGDAVIFRPADPYVEREPLTEPPTVDRGRSEEPFGLFLERESADVDPGQTLQLLAEVINRSDQSDRVRLDVQGVPDSWLELPRFTTVAAGEQVELPFTIRPPRSADVEAKAYPLDVSLISQRYPNTDVRVASQVTVRPFESFETSLSPEEFSLPETVEVSITNKGNTPATYSVTRRESDGLLSFTGETGRVEVKPNQTVAVQILVEGQSGIFGSRSSGEIPFEVEVRAESGGLQGLHGVARQRRGIMAFLIPLLLAVMGIALVAACLVFSQRALTAMFTRGVDTPTPRGTAFVGLSTNTPDLGGVPTTIITNTLTTTLTPVNPNDPDGDGLSNEQELLLGTDPDNPDTDGDGLSDGEELSVTATDPLRLDTDNDELNDWVEINTTRTDPRQFDTDADGVGDGAEVRNGTDPLVPNNVTPTNTAESPTLLPTNTAIIITPTPLAATNTTVVIIASPSNTPVIITPTPLPATPTPVVASPTPIVATLTPVTPLPTNTPENPLPTDTLTIVPSASETPVTPLPTKTATPVVTTVVETPTNVPLPPTQTLPTQSLFCQQLPPTLDGLVDLGEWNNATLGSMSVNALSGADLFGLTDGSRLYFAFEVADETNEATDSVRLYLDLNGNGGDPDTADRQLLIGRDGTIQFSLGSGTNDDGNTWTLGTVAADWQISAVLDDGFIWSVEVSVPVSNPSAPFGMMGEVLFTNAGLDEYPPGAVANTLSTWRFSQPQTPCP